MEELGQGGWGRRAAVVGTAGPLAFMVLVALLGLAWPGYDPVRQTQSELGAVDSPVRWAMNVGGFMLLGVSFLALALAFRTLVRASMWRTLVVLLLVVAGAGMVAVGFAPCDAGCVDVTSTGRWHSALSAPGPIGVSLAIMASGPALGVDGRFSSRWQRGSVVLGAVVLLSGPVIALELFAPVAGLVQRVAMGAALVWISAVGARLVGLSRAAAPGGAGPPSRSAERDAGSR